MAKKKTPGTTPPRNGAGRTPSGPGTYFLSLKVQNVRCFGGEPQTLDMSDGEGRPARWTILFGENGTGKTTLLQVLAGFETVAEPSLFIRAFEWALARNVILPRIGFRATAEAKLAMRPDLEKREREGSQTNALFYLSSGPIGETVPRLPGPDWRNLKCYGYGAGRRLGTTSLSGSDSDAATLSLASDDWELRNAEEWLLQLDYSASKESRFQERQRKRRDQIKVLLIGVLQVEDIRFTVPEGVRPIPFVEFKTADGWVPLRQLGHGYRTTTAWVVDLASRLVERDPDNDDPLAQPAVVLVDEIDLHMHPKWQRHLMKDLSERFPNTQFVVTAHSPLIAQAAEDANLVLLRREGDHVVIENKMPVLHGWRIDQVLTSDLFGLPSSRPPQLDALLQRRREILTKAKLTEADKKELARLEEQIGYLPGGETAEEVRRLKNIEEALELLQRARGDES